MSAEIRRLIALPLAVCGLFSCLLLYGCSGTTSADSTAKKYSQGAKDPGTGNPEDAKPASGEKR
jgi:hypothetical protein